MGSRRIFWRHSDQIWSILDFAMANFDRSIMVGNVNDIVETGTQLCFLLQL